MIKCDRPGVVKNPKILAEFVDGMAWNRRKAYPTSKHFIVFIALLN